jgi:acid stress-induced BolA-like protein IbaG/YrbA
MARGLELLFHRRKQPCDAAIMNAAEVQSLIETGLPGAQVRVSSPDDTHFEAVIVAPQFEGKRTIQRHQLVYGTLGVLMGREIHALSMQVLAPSEANARN